MAKNRAIQYLIECKEELKKVVWPTKKQLINHTWLVIGISLATAAFLGISDYLFNLGIEKLIK
ncbi:MAG: preprotein translocase subunit SecE [bacterium]